MQARIMIRLKDGILDPQGEASQSALNTLGFDQISNLRIGKEITLNLPDQDHAAARAYVTKLCEALLVNQVMEDYEIELEGADA